MLLWALLAPGQISLRQVDGWRTLARTSIAQPIDLAGRPVNLEMPEIASPNSNTTRDSTSTIAPGIGVNTKRGNHGIEKQSDETKTVLLRPSGNA